MKISFRKLIELLGVGICNLAGAYDAYHGYKVANHSSTCWYKALPGAGLMQADLHAAAKARPIVLSNADLRGVNLMRSCAIEINFSGSDFSPLPGVELAKIEQKEALGRRHFIVQYELHETENSLKSPSIDGPRRVQLESRRADLLRQKAKLLGISEVVSGESFLERVARMRSQPVKAKGPLKPLAVTDLRPDRASNLCQADLRNAKFYKANLTKVNLSGSHLAGANFREANLTGANLESTHVWDLQYGAADFRGVRGLDLAHKKLLWIKGALIDLTYQERDHYVSDLSHLNPEQQALVLGELD